MWSAGCIFAELLLKEPLFQAKTEIELISMIFKLLGPPTTLSWPEYSTLPLAKTITLPCPQPHQFRQRFHHMTTAGIDLLMSLLTYNPEQRITAEEALRHPYFRSQPLSSINSQANDVRCSESPLPKHPDLFGSFPSAAAGERYVCQVMHIGVMLNTSIIDEESLLTVRRHRREQQITNSSLKLMFHKQMDTLYNITLCKWNIGKIYRGCYDSPMLISICRIF